MNRNGLDEMQLQERNRIGNQSFLLLLYLLLFDSGLYGFGIRWAPYPSNVMAILCLCAGIYTIRLIRNNAYIGPSTKVSKISRNTAAIAVGSAFVALLLAIILITSGAMDLSKLKGMKDNGAIILLLTSMIALVILGITGAIRKKQNAVDDEEEKNKL